MTPLAQKFFRQLTLPKKDRRVMDNAGTLAKLDGLHCFELSAVADAVNAAIENEGAHVVRAAAQIAHQLFLPAERTWLEVRHEGDNVHAWAMPGERTAVLIEAIAPGKYRLTLVLGELLASLPIGTFEVTNSPLASPWIGRAIANKGFNDRATPEQRQAMLNRFIVETLLFLDMINTPGLVGLKSHQPHRGLERSLRQNGVGKYPLRAWSEVLIKPGVIEAGPEDHEGHLTGRKCLHFVRAHRRQFQDGRQTIVTHHWRGDPALGIKRTRYRIER
jgi:hypothetical protein